MEGVVIALFAPLLIMVILTIVSYWLMKAVISVAGFTRSLLDD